MSIWEQVLREYWDRTGFVVLHGLLIVIYLIAFVHSCRLLLRERRALGRLRGALGELPQVEAVHYPSGEPVRLAKFRELLKGAPDSSLTEQLRGLLENAGGGEEFDSQKVISRTAHAISWTDDIARFCVNGLVVVGLMGTLVAFYQMWRGSPGALAASSATYLENMSTALIVSLVGLSLAMLTNLSLSVLRACRQKHFSAASALLVPVGGLLTADSKTHLLLQELMLPLQNLVRQLTVQNDEVLRGLTKAVETRTEELNTLIAKSTLQWQGAIRDFKTEMMAAVGNLQSASSGLAGSARDVGATMREVAKGLERTKDIGLIVGKLEKTSEEIVARIGAKLDGAVSSWEVTLAAATRGYEQAISTQSAALKTLTGTLTADAANNFNAVAAKISADLNTLKSKYLDDAEAVGSKWMTELSNVETRVGETLGKIVVGWQTAVSDTATQVGTSLTGARDLMREMAAKSAELGARIGELQRLTGELSERAGAPLYLAEVVTELNNVSTGLGKMLTELTPPRLFGGLQDAVADNTREMRALRGDIARPGLHGDGAAAAAQPLKEISTGLLLLRGEVQTLSTILQSRVASGAARRAPGPPPTRWGRFKNWVGRRKPAGAANEGGNGQDE